MLPPGGNICCRRSSGERETAWRGRQRLPAPGIPGEGKCWPHPADFGKLSMMRRSTRLPGLGILALCLAAATPPVITPKNDLKSQAADALKRAATFYHA